MLLNSIIIEKRSSRHLQLDGPSRTAVHQLVSVYGLSGSEFLSKLEHIFGEDDWPWVVVMMPRDRSLTAHFMEIRGVHKHLPLISYSYMAERKPYSCGYPLTGALLFMSRGVARRMAKASPVIAAWWSILQNLPAGTTHLLIVDEPDPALVVELSVNREQRIRAVREKSAKIQAPEFVITSPQAERLLQSAVALHLSKHHEGFLRRLPELYRYFPDHPTLLNQEAVALNMLSRWQEALDLSRRVLMRRPWFLGAVESHGYAASRLGFYRLALASYRRVVEIDCHNKLGWSGIFRMNKALGNLEGMLEAIQPMADLEEATMQDWVDLGEALINAGRAAEAVLVMERLLLDHPDQPICMNNYAFALIKAGRAKEAIPFCDAALRCDPDYPLFLDTHAWLLHQLGRSQEALSVIQRALTIQPDYQVGLATQECILSEMGLK